MKCGDATVHRATLSTQGAARAKALQLCVEHIRNADLLCITAGAGMGVDSGLPDFRGNEGFWKAYPPLKALNVEFTSMANPAWFTRDPTLAWGFYGHRLDLYRKTTPHDGFTWLRQWAEQTKYGGFVFTSNVDGQFQKAGFGSDRIWEVHGSLHHVQCELPCSDRIHRAVASSTEPQPTSEPYPDYPVELAVSLKTLRAEQRSLPSCPSCSTVMRPNVLMFGDAGWLSERSDAQSIRFHRWLAAHKSGARLVVVECGAGQAVPTVRSLSEQLCSKRSGNPGFLVRLNVRDPDVPGHTNGVGLDVGALDGLRALKDVLES